MVCACPRSSLIHSVWSTPVLENELHPASARSPLVAALSDQPHPALLEADPDAPSSTLGVMVTPAGPTPPIHRRATWAKVRPLGRLCAGLDEQRLQAVEASIATGLDLARHRQLLPELARLCAEHPVRERLVELHMRALYRHGRTAEALDVYHQARTR